MIRIDFEKFKDQYISSIGGARRMLSLVENIFEILENSTDIEAGLIEMLDQRGLLLKNIQPGSKEG